MPARFQAMILLTTFASLRFGEVTALERRDIDLKAGTVTVPRAFVEVRGEVWCRAPPKSQAGRRTVSVPPTIVEAMRAHLTSYVDEDPSALVFTSPKGGAVRRGNLRKLTRWTKLMADLGTTGVRVHDLRHTGNTLAARSAVSTRDLMARMGHDSVRAAIIYQHATTEADARIAATLEAELTTDDDGGQAPDADCPDDDDDGTAGALVPAGR